jgi:hypothetical protein
VAPESAEVTLVVFQKEIPKPMLNEYTTVKNQDGLRVAWVDLVPGEYHYFFRINENVVVDPKAPRQEEDDFGGGNSLLTLERKDDGSMKIY